MSTTPDRAAAPAPLAPGWYWVQLPSKKWSAAKCEIGQHTRAPIFFIVGSDHTFIERDLREIGPRIPSPDERATPDSALAEAVRWAEAIEAAKRIVTLHEMPRKRPTIEELERLLQQPDGPAVTINPDGSISAGVSDALVVARTLLAALDGREAWNEAMRNGRSMLATLAGPSSISDPAIAACLAEMDRALARPQPAGEAT